MKKMFLTIVAIVSLTVLSGCADTTEPRDYNETNDTVVEGEDISSDEKATAWTYSEIEINKLFGLANAKVDGTSEDFHVVKLPDDRSPDGKTDYKNLHSVIGYFTYQEKRYRFSMMYSLVDADSYKVIMLNSQQYDGGEKVVDHPLMSDND